MVEQRTENPCVPGSNPGSTTKASLRWLFLCAQPSFALYSFSPLIDYPHFLYFDSAQSKTDRNGPVLNPISTRGFNLLVQHIQDQAQAQKVFLLIDDFFKNNFDAETHLNLIENAPIFWMHAGEKSKSIPTVESIWKWLLENKVDKSDMVIIMGGGTVLDTGAFAASTFQRGLNFSLIPTTLLAMVDASIGGKNGVNFFSNKNYIGSISLPRVVATDFAFLHTLSKSQILEGWMEMVKHGLVHDAAHWRSLHALETLPGPRALLPFIQRSSEIKQSAVKEDLRESGARKKLNFGHTIAHALEGLAHRSEISLTHGVAVGIGMIFSIEYSRAMSSSDEARSEFDRARQRIQEWLDEGADPLTISWAKGCNPEEVWRQMQGDKKNRSGQVLEVVLTEIGAAKWDQPMELGDFLAIWKVAMS